MREIIMASPLVEIRYDVMRMIASIIVFLVLYLLAMAYKGLTPGKVYRLSIFVIAIGIASVLVTENFVTLAYFVFMIGYLVFQIVVWVNAASLAIDKDISPFFAFGLGWGCLYLGLFLGKAVTIGYDLIFPQAVGVMYLPLVSVMIIMIIVAYQFGLTQPNLTTESENPKRSRYYDRCKQVITHYGLTQRQGDVLFLLAQGKSAKIIQSKLNLSAGTVNTHISHIYRRLEISSRDELVELIESWKC